MTAIIKLFPFNKTFLSFDSLDGNAMRGECAFGGNSENLNISKIVFAACLAQNDLNL